MSRPVRGGATRPLSATPREAWGSRSRGEQVLVPAAATAHAGEAVLQRAIATQAEAERTRRATVIAATGEFQAAAKLSEAAAVLSREPIAITLRYLQTLIEIGTEKNTTIVFPLPLDLLGGLGIKPPSVMPESPAAPGGV